jgi:hypothetical protein
MSYKRTTTDICFPETHLLMDKGTMMSAIAKQCGVNPDSVV